MTRRTRVIIAVATVVAVAAGLVAAFITLRSGRTGPATPATTATSSSTSVAASGEVTNVTVYFHRGRTDDPRDVVAVRRSVARTEAVATAALNELLPGPTERERADGYWSMFVPRTARMLKSVRVVDGVAHVDFRDFREIITNAGSGYGSAALLAELDTTLRQFPAVQSTEYSFDGDVPAFYLWLQLTPPGMGDEAGAVAAARSFLGEAAGMRKVIGGPFRRTGNGLAEVTCYPASPNDDTRPITTLPTVVSLQRSGGGWTVTGTRAEAIQVDVPGSGDVVRSPASVSGQAHVFEGTVTVRVLADKGGAEVGRGFVTGGGDALRPFSGQVTFAQPNGGGGWVLFQEESAANGDVVLTTAVRVAFAGSAEPSATVQR